jgi:heptosyltransferase-3
LIRALAIQAARIVGALGANRNEVPLVPSSDSISFLVMNLGGIGNALLVTPLLAELRRLWPNSCIDFLTVGASAQIMATNSDVTSLVVDPLVRAKNPWAAYRASYRTIRRARYDVCFLTLLSLGFSFSSRMPLARIPVRVIHKYGFRPAHDQTVFCTHRVPYGYKHDVENNLDLLRALTPAEVRNGPLSLPIGTTDREAARTHLERSGWKGTGRTVGLCPGSGPVLHQKRWPEEFYVELAKGLLSDHRDLNIIVFCGPDESVVAERLRGTLKDERVTFVLDLPLAQYPGALDQCNVVVSGDSLPVHVCAALQKNLVALYGPSDPVRTGPWMAKAAVLTPGKDYPPFFSIPYRPDPSDFVSRMPLIPVGQVRGALESFLHETSGSISSAGGRDQA